MWEPLPQTVALGLFASSTVWWGLPIAILVSSALKLQAGLPGRRAHLVALVMALATIILPVVRTVWIVLEDGFWNAVPLANQTTPIQILVTLICIWFWIVGAWMTRLRPRASDLVVTGLIAAGALGLIVVAVMSPPLNVPDGVLR